MRITTNLTPLLFANRYLNYQNFIHTHGVNNKPLHSPTLKLSFSDIVAFRCFVPGRLSAAAAWPTDRGREGGTETWRLGFYRRSHIQTSLHERAVKTRIYSPLLLASAAPAQRLSDVIGYAQFGHVCQSQFEIECGRGVVCQCGWSKFCPGFVWTPLVFAGWQISESVTHRLSVVLTLYCVKF